MSTLGQASVVSAQTTEPKVIFSYLDPVKGNYCIITQPVTASELFTEFCNWACKNGIPIDWNLKSEPGSDTVTLFICDWDLSLAGEGDLLGDSIIEALDQPRFEVHASEKTAGLGVIVINLPSDPRAIFTQILRKAREEGYENPTRILPRDEFYLDAENNKLIAKGWHVIIDSALPQAYSVAGGWIDSNHCEIRNTKDIAAAIDKKMMQLEQAGNESIGNQSIAEDSNTGINTQEANTAMAGQEFPIDNNTVVEEAVQQEARELHEVPATLTAAFDGTGTTDSFDEPCSPDEDSNKHIGSTLDSFLEEEGITDAVNSAAALQAQDLTSQEEDIGTIPNPLEQTFDKRFVGGNKQPAEAFGRPDEPEHGIHESPIGAKPKRDKKPRDQRLDGNNSNFLVEPGKNRQQRTDHPQRDGRQERNDRKGRPGDRQKQYVADEAPTFQPRVGRVQIDSNILSTIKDRLAKNTQNDGEHFININFSGKTELGRALDMTAHAAFEHPDFGHFESVTAFMFYITATETDDSLRGLHGVHCRNHRRNISLRFMDGWRAAVAEAIWLRVCADPKLMNWMIGNSLPYRSQYLDPEKSAMVTTKDSNWLVPTVRAIEQALKEAVKYPDREVVPNFGFLNTIERQERLERQERAQKQQRREQPRRQYA